MPKNNCIQCESNGKYKIRGKNDSECIYIEYEDCTNAKAGYDQNVTSVAALLFSQGVSDVYDDSDEDSLFPENTPEEDSEGGTDVDDSTIYCNDEKGKVYSHVLGRCVDIKLYKDGEENTCEEKGNTDPNDTTKTHFYIWSIQQQKCVQCKIGQYWEDDLQKCIWINDEFDDLPDYYPCDEINAEGGCGDNGRCEEGQCICDDGYENEDKDDRSTPCVEVSGSDSSIDPKDINTFDLEAGYKISNRIEYSVLALTISFNPSHNTSKGGGWKGHINKDLPVWRAAQVHSGAKLPETLKYNDGPLKNYAGKVPPDEYINPILSEMFVRGKTMANEKMAGTFGTWYGKSYDGNKDRRALTHYKQGASGGYCFPSKASAFKKGDDKRRAYWSGRWGYNYKYDIDGLKTGNGWVFCAYGISYAFDLFRMKYNKEVNPEPTGKVPGGSGLFQGSLGSVQVVKKNGKGHGGSEYNSKENENFCLFTTGKGKSLTNSEKNKLRLTRMINWKGAIFAYRKLGEKTGGHVGMVLHVEQPSIPEKAAIWTLEYNTTLSGGNADGGYLAFRKRRIKGHQYWVFASTDHLFGGTWAPKGLGDFEYLKDLLGVTGNPDFDESGELSTTTLETYFTE
jgi:hypothetical protein